MDHPLDSVDPDGTFRHLVPLHPFHRWIFLISGTFVMIITLHELGRGVWPLNITSPFFAMLIVGAFTVGGPIAFAGIFAPSLAWTVRTGRIEITMTNPWRSWTRHFIPATIVGFELREHDHDSGPNSFSVVMVTTAGERYETRDFGSQTAAEDLRDRIDGLFRA